eukprot:Em0001g2437a
MERGWYQNALITVTGDHKMTQQGAWCVSILMSVPTDCDQRDERLRWMGDAGLSSDSMLLNFHMDSFLPHYTQLMDDDKPYTGLSFTSAFSFLLNVKQTSELAQALGQQNDVATLTSIFTTQSASFNKSFFNGHASIVPADSYYMYMIIVIIW